MWRERPLFAPRIEGRGVHYRLKRMHELSCLLAGQTIFAENEKCSCDMYVGIKVTVAGFGYRKLKFKVGWLKVTAHLGCMTAMDFICLVTLPIVYDWALSGYL